MKLSDYKGEDALDLIADILEPSMEIIGDPEIKETARSKDKNLMQIVKIILKKHKKSILEIMARIDGEDPDEYNPTFFELPKKILELLNDESLIDLFTSQGQKEVVPLSGSATVISEEAETE